MRSLRIGLFLGWKQIQRANIWTSALIITIVILTILNLVVVSGMLNGITTGVLKTVRNELLGDIIISPLDGQNHIKDSQRIIKELRTYHDVKSFSPHYEGLVTIEANYQNQRDLNADKDIVAVNIQGIDPELEDQTLNLSSLIAEGDYLEPEDRGYILIGKHYVDRYAKEYGNVFDSLKDIYPGSVVMISNGVTSREFTVKGIVDSKLDGVSLNVYMSELDFRRLFNRVDFEADKILVRLSSEATGPTTISRLIDAGYENNAKVELFGVNIPKYIRDITNTFDLLSAVVGAISIFVATITVFIIIFINTLSRRQHIGILKAVGLNKKSLQYAYAIQALFYGLIGTVISTILIYTTIIPYFTAHPIDFPYTDVELSISPVTLFYNCLFLLIMMLLSGFIPAWIIIRKNTLDSILGRK